MASAILRDQTRAEHLRTEAVFNAFEIGTEAGYADFLTAQAAAFLPIEQALDEADMAALIADWGRRRRGDLLRQDLADLGITARCNGRVPELPSQAAMLGAAYVLEGSRLGGKILRRMVPDGVPTRFLGAEGETGAWKSFQSSLSQNLPGPIEVAEAVTAARAVFQRFEQAARELVEPIVERP